MRLGLKDILLFQLPGMLKGLLAADTSGHTLTIRKDGKVLVAAGFGEVDTCFDGKGSPGMCAKAIELLAIWIVLVRDILGRRTARSTVGALKIGKRFIPKRPHDLAVENLQTMVDGYLGVDCNGSYHHVAMVSAVLQYWPREALLILSESRTRAHGGPQSNVWRVRRQAIKEG